MKIYQAITVLFVLIRGAAVVNATTSDAQDPSKLAAD